MNLIKNWFQSHFGFSRSEMNGTLVLFILILISAIAPRIYFSHKIAHLQIEQPDREKLLVWATEMNKSIELKPKQTLQNNQISNNQNFTTYKKREYPKTKTYEKRENPTSKTPKATEPIPIISIDLNVADAKALTAVRGIGPVLSERIIKYRDRLGGFSDTTQLHEVYGLKSETIDELKKHIFIEKPTVASIPLNTDSLKSLFSHPYVDYQLARHIINYRQVHGDYQDISEIQSLKLLSDSLYQKLYPYLSLKD